jgi:hypothetical protein
MLYESGADMHKLLELVLHNSDIVCDKGKTGTTGLLKTMATLAYAPETLPNPAAQLPGPLEMLVWRNIKTGRIVGLRY